MLALVYDDRHLPEGTGGVSPALLCVLLAELRAAGDTEAAGVGFEVATIDARAIRAGELDRSGAAALVIPGGQDLAYVRELGPKGRGAIGSFVAAGGGVLGICAGAYYLASSIVYEGMNGPPPFPGSTAPASGEAQAAIRMPAIEGERGGGLFDGTARGAHRVAGCDPFAGGALDGAGVTSLSMAGELVSALYWCGPSLHPADPDCWDVLASYSDLGSTFGAAAAVSGTVGAGRVVLSGVHAEVSRDGFELVRAAVVAGVQRAGGAGVDDRLVHRSALIADALASAEPGRTNLWHRLLRETLAAARAEPAPSHPRGTQP